MTDQQSRLITHGRQDAAHALCNTISILKMLSRLEKLAVTIIVLLVIALGLLLWIAIRA